MSVVPIIIPFYREHEKLRKCKAAIAAQSHTDCEVFVRDNTHDNILYTAAVNEGLVKFCYRDDVRYVIVLNQDAYMEKDCVRQLFEFMEANPECGIACPLQYANDDSGIRAYGAATPRVRRVTWGGSYQAFPLGVHQKDPFESYTRPFETFWANGACMMIRTAVVREVGVFDRNMRFICSDSDFSFTARARGWKIFVVPQALSEHQLGGSGTESPPELQLVKCRDGIYFAEKWLTGGVYRRLAHEGRDLTPIHVRLWLARLKRNVQELERQLGQPPSQAGAALVSMMTEGRLPPQRSLLRR
jgi:GT2 family glycosyltransferase